MNELIPDLSKTQSSAVFPAMKLKQLSTSISSVENLRILVMNSRIYLYGHKKNKQGIVEIRRDADKIIEIAHNISAGEFLMREQCGMLIPLKK